jgi:hypothetical protein
MKISNLAVCFYGQYRTGDICVPHLKTIISSIKVNNIDIFCSVKTATSYHTPDNANIHDYMKSAIELQQSETLRIQDFLSMQLNPVRINFINDPDQLSNDIGDGFTDRGDMFVSTGIIDTLLLKQQHEAKTGVFYDAVLLLRYDIVLRPLDYLDKLLDNIINNNNDATVWPNDPDSIIAPKMNNGKWDFDFALMPDTINDLLLLFTGAGADRVCYELLRIINSTTTIYRSHTVYRHRVANLLTLHVILTKLSGMISLPLIDMPGITVPFPQDGESSGNMYNFKDRFNTVPTEEARLVTARPHTAIAGLDPNRNADFDIIIKIWLNIPD